MLQLQDIEVIYLGVILVLKGVSIEVPEGKIVALLGANGAGKSTTLKAISGLLSVEEGRVTRGKISFEDERIENRSPQDIARMGIIQIMEGRPALEQLTTEENLVAAFLPRSRGDKIKVDLDRVYSYFPRLKELRNSSSGYLSGGERQMLVMGRGLMAHPKVMLPDEPSLGLAPLLVKEVFNMIERINSEEKTSILLVEQNAMVALSIAEHAYVMENGRIVLDGPAPKIMDNPDVKEFYLGLTEIGRKSFRDVKHYKRRKRWLA